MRPFSNVDNFRLEVDSDVVSSVVKDPTGVKVPVKFGDSRSNRSLRDEQRRLQRRRTPVIT